MARTLVGMKEVDAVISAYRIAYQWHVDNGISAPTQGDLESRMAEDRYHFEVSRQVFTYLNEHGCYTDEGDRRYRVSQRAYKKLHAQYQD